MTKTICTYQCFIPITNDQILIPNENGEFEWVPIPEGSGLHGKIDTYQESRPMISVNVSCIKDNELIYSFTHIERYGIATEIYYNGKLWVFNNDHLSYSVEDNISIDDVPDYSVDSNGIEINDQLNFLS